MKRLALVLALAACGHDTGWSRYERGGFTVEAPGSPEEEPINAATPLGSQPAKLYMFTGALLVTVVDFRKATAKPDPAAVIEFALDNALSDLSGAKLESRTSIPGGDAGLDAMLTISDRDGPAKARFRFLYKDQRLYQAQGLYQDDKDAAPDRFIDSFKLTEQ